MRNEIILTSDSESIQYLCKKDKRLAKVISTIGPIAYAPQEEDSYRFLVTTIIGQMLSNKVAEIITTRLDTLCKGRISPDVINALSDEEIRSIGISKSKVNYIRNLTNEIENGNLNFNAFSNMTDKEIMKNLTSIRGIGNWSAKMYLIFELDRQDVLPLEDMAFLQSYGWLYKTKDYSSATVSAKCRKWKPYSSIAARYLYYALDNGLTKEEFHLYK